MFDPWVGKIPWRRKWQPTPIFLPGKFHGQRGLVGYSSWGLKELGTTEHTYTNLKTNLKKRQMLKQPSKNKKRKFIK